MIYIAHVKTGFEERFRSISVQMDRLKLSYILMLDGDMEDIDSDILDKYFAGEMKIVNAQTSCALKHLLIYEEIQKQQLTDALIFEDDIILSNNFNEVYNCVQEEIKKNQPKQSKYFISYENSGLQFIKSEEAKKGKFLYKAKQGRCAGAYSVSLAAVEYMLNRLKNEKMSLPVDWWHNKMFESGEIEVFWCHPPIAEQGSHSGFFSSSIATHRKKSLMRRLHWAVKKYFKIRIQWKKVKDKNR